MIELASSPIVLTEVLRMNAPPYTAQPLTTHDSLSAHVDASGRFVPSTHLAKQLYTAAVRPVSATDYVRHWWRKYLHPEAEAPRMYRKDEAIEVLRDVIGTTLDHLLFTEANVATALNESKHTAGRRGSGFTKYVADSLTERLAIPERIATDFLAALATELANAATTQPLYYEWGKLVSQGDNLILEIRPLTERLKRRKALRS